MLRIDNEFLAHKYYHKQKNMKIFIFIFYKINILFQPRTLPQYSAVRFDSRSSYKNYLYIHLMLTSITSNGRLSCKELLGGKAKLSKL